MMEVPIIQHKIYEIRGQRVMLDFDLINLYEVETRVLNQAIKRNLDNFPDDFMFRLSSKEWEKIASSISILNADNGKSNSSQFVMSCRKHQGKA